MQDILTLEKISHLPKIQKVTLISYSSSQLIQIFHTDWLWHILRPKHYLCLSEI